MRLRTQPPLLTYLLTTQSCYRAADCTHKGHKTTYRGNHAPSGMLAMYIFSHPVQIGPVPKYTLCL